MSDDELFYGSDEDEKVHDSNDELEETLDEIESVDDAKSTHEDEDMLDNEEEEEEENDEEANEHTEDEEYEGVNTKKRKSTVVGKIARCRSNETLVSARSTKSSKSSKSSKTSKRASIAGTKSRNKKVGTSGSTKKKPVLNSKLEKIYLSAKQQERVFRPLPNSKEASDDSPALPTKKPIAKNSTWYRSTVSETLCEPVGFEGPDDFAARIQASKTNTFEIERSFLLNKTRFVPFGPKEFYKNCPNFYTQPTAIACWWCTESFHSVPVPMPVRYHEDCADPERSYWQVTGVFCSPSCMLAKSRSIRTSENLARLFLKRAYCLKTVEVACAPDPLSLKKFGGKYSIEQFRATGGAGIKTIPHNMPFLPVSAGLCEIESFVTVIREEGGAELAKKRFNGKAVFGSNIVPITSASVYVQKSVFAQAPTIDQQIKQSDSKLRLQQQQAPKSKTANILSFMSLTKHTEPGVKK